MMEFLFGGIILTLIVAVAVWIIFFRKRFIEASNLAVFISGCDTGLGNRLAIYFDSLGCEVFAGCLNAESARKTLPNSVTVIQLDVCKEDSVTDAVKTVKQILNEKNKDLWALINNAGVCIYGEFEWQTWDQCQKQVNVNLLGTMRMTKAFLPLLRKSKGRLVTVTSVNGFIAYPGLSVYCATKFGLEGLHHALRLELRRQHGIKVITVQPGDIARLTSIMSQHETNAQEMWVNMSEEDRDEFGSYFRKYQRVTMKNYGLTSPESFERSPILHDMKHAVLSKTPQTRYISAQVQYSLLYQTLAMLPFRILDAFMDSVTDMIFKTDEES